MEPTNKPLITYSTRLLLLCFLFSLSFISCEKDKSEIADLEFYSETYYLSEGESMSIPIINGNHQYSLNISDESLLNSIINNEGWPAGEIEITGLKKGTVKLSVTDQICLQTVQLTVHIVDPFIAMELQDYGLIVDKATDYEEYKAIKDEIDNWIDIEHGSILILQAGNGHKYSIFKTRKDLSKGIVDKSGTYGLSFNYGGPNRLNLKDAESGKTVEFKIHTTKEQSFRKFLNFCRNNSGLETIPEEEATNQERNIDEVKAEVRQNTSPVINYDLFLVHDLTTIFKNDYPHLNYVELFQGMIFVNSRYDTVFGEGVLSK